MARKNRKLEITPAASTPAETSASVIEVTPATPAKEEAKGIRGMSKLAIYRSHYVRATHTGDALATALDGKDLPTVARVGAEVLGVSTDELLTRYIHLNVGQRRMNIGNRIRAAIRKDASLMEKVTKVLGQ